MASPDTAPFQKVKEWAEDKNVAVEAKEDKIVLKTYWHMIMDNLGELKDLPYAVDEVYTNSVTENIVVELMPL